MNETASHSAVSTIGPWIVSIAALLQVWILGAWRHFRPGKVRVHESSNIEIGFASFGPSIGLTGTLQRLHKDAFIRRLEVVVTRVTDGQTHKLNWKALHHLFPCLRAACGVRASFNFAYAQYANWE